jgi:type IV pilus assembly protein PilY1
MKSLLMSGLCALAMLLAGVARADDTDIYLNPRTDPVDEPMVMFSLDYRPNLGSSAKDYTSFFVPLLPQGINDPDLPKNRPWTFFDVLRLSLKVVFLEVSGVKVGLMLNHNYKNGCEGPSNVKSGCSNGAYIARGFRSIQEGDANGAVEEFAKILRAVPLPQGNLSHSFQGAELFFELFRYLTGQGVYNGHNGFIDYAGDSKINIDVEFPGASWDKRIETTDGKTYISPLSSANQCTKIFTVNLMFQVSNQDSNSNAAIAAQPSAGGLGFDPGSSNTFRNMIAALNQTDLGDGRFGTVPAIDGLQNVTSYFVIDPRFINNTTRGYAEAGGTGRPLSFAEDPAELIDALRNILREILSVSTTFVSASVPVNVFNRAEIVDNVYVALFQAESTPRWSGNVKKLLLKETVAADGSSDISLVDANGELAVAGDGRIRFDALTYWTDPTGRDLVEEDIEQGLFAGKDGRHTRRGAAGQQIPGYLAGDPGALNADGKRRLFFADGGTFAALDDTDAVATKLQSRLGAADLTEARQLVRYIRGYDVANPTGVRDWIMGDPMHSRPLPINYGSLGSFTETNQAIYLAFGSNDGFLRMIRNTKPGSTVVQDGSEVWAFMPDETMAIQKRLRDNLANDEDLLHPYGVDGAPAALLQGVGPNGVPSKAYLYFGLRRGGKAIYALNVTDPENPAMLWKISPSTAGFEKLALTFSRPQIGRVTLAGVRTPVVIFAGGYDRNKDYYTGIQPKATGSTIRPIGTNDSTGTAIYVVNAETGALIWTGTHTSLVDSIPTDLTIGDTTGDGTTDRIVFGDTGGNIWRADLAGDTTSEWSIHQVGRMGRHHVNDKTNDRRFFHAPDVVKTKDSDGVAYDAIVIGTGDREDPLDRSGMVENFLYVIRDYNIFPLTKTEKADPNLAERLAVVTHADLVDISNCAPNDPDPACGTGFDNGWRMKLQIGPGEKNLSSPFTFSGTVFFTTYLPPGTIEAKTCGPSEGSGALYAVNLEDGSPRFNFDSTTEETADGEATTTSDRYRLLSAGGIPSDVVYIGGGNLLLGDLSIIQGQVDNIRTYWRRSEE